MTEPNEPKEPKEPNSSRRDFVKKGAYIAPAVLTLAVAPEFAKAGSVKPDEPKGGGMGASPGGGGHGGPGRGHGAGGKDRPGRVEDGRRRGGGWLGRSLRDLVGRR